MFASTQTLFEWRSRPPPQKTRLKLIAPNNFTGSQTSFQGSSQDPRKNITHITLSPNTLTGAQAAFQWKSQNPRKKRHNYYIIPQAAFRRRAQNAPHTDSTNITLSPNNSQAHKLHFDASHKTISKTVNMTTSDDNFTSAQLSFRWRSQHLQIIQQTLRFSRLLHKYTSSSSVKKYNYCILPRLLHKHPSRLSMKITKPSKNFTNPPTPSTAERVRFRYD